MNDLLGYPTPWFLNCFLVTNNTAQIQFCRMPTVFLAQSPEENASLKCPSMRVVPAMSIGDGRGVGGNAGRTPWVVQFPSASAILFNGSREKEQRGSSVGWVEGSVWK